MKTDLPYYYAWGNNPVRAQFKGKRCRMICRGTLNSCLLEFIDGRRIVTSRNAIRKVKDGLLSESGSYRA